VTAEVTGYDPAGWGDLLAFVISIVVASVNSWVLLVEVLR
jgi:hypothetical protein